MRRYFKYRALRVNRLLSVAFLLGIPYLWFQWQRSSAPTPSSGAENSRSPASLDAEPALPKHCSDFYQTVCKPKARFQDPTGVVRPDHEGEISALRIYQNIIRNNPNWDLARVDEELVNHIYTPKATARIQSAYRWVQGAILDWIGSYPASILSDKDKKNLAELIRLTRLELPPPASRYDDERELFTKNDVFYEHEQSDGVHVRRMRVGGAFVLNIKSWFNLVFTIAHEFGHSIDPCELRANGIEIPAYQELGNCFLKQGLIASSSDRMECVRNDQLSESFADWLAVKITHKVLREYSSEFPGEALLYSALNSVRDLCEEDETNPSSTEFHASPRVRIEKIFGSNPGIRELLGCPIPSDESYCEFVPVRINNPNSTGDSQ